MSVPVLSKTMRFTLPATFTLGGEIQKIFFFFNLLIAKTVPTVIAAGRAGGTVIVIKSSDLSIIGQAAYPYLIIKGKVPMKPSTAMTPMTMMNLSES